MRAAMPTVAGWIDELRAEFGPAVINRAMAQGVRGEPDRFHAAEGGQEIGTPFRPVGHAVRILE